MLGGAAARFRQAVAEHYGVPAGHWAGPEPHVAEEILTGWLERAGVRLLRGERLVGAEVEHGRITALRTAAGTEVRAGVHVDASYEGDLLAAAGVPTAVGRESRHAYGEELAGRQEVVPGKHATPSWISPFVDDPAGRTAGALLPQVKPEPLVPVGAADGGVMAYGYRACLSSGPDRRPFTRPDDFDDAYWELGRWGWPGDEFEDSEGLPHQLYVREARRMVGDLVLTEHDLRHPRHQPDTVALGSYHLDVREVQRGWRWVHEHPDPVAMVVTEGYFSVRVPPYPIPYRALVPAERHCTNLLVPVCVSASHVAFSSLRMEVQYQMLGEAAGTAAALAVGGSGRVQQVDVAELQTRLRAAGAVLDLPG